MLFRNLEAFDNLVSGQEVVIPISPNKSVAQVQQDIKRLQVLSNFANLSGKGRQIEEEWQKIQQDENNEIFAFQVSNGRNSDELAYRKGIVKGIQWCVERFS